MSCIFCRIIKGEIPSFKIVETAKRHYFLERKSNNASYAFLDIQPLSRGHALVIPKEHGAKFHDLSDETLADLLPVAKKVALALGIKDYNLLQNNGTSNCDGKLIKGRIAHQVVDHVHFHVAAIGILH
jgi:diadenosine tetraphosphate (Ap4A) HIT family hydrolase